MVIESIMKAISIRQPWADLIVHGHKTLELRRWTVNYRGPLAIHAAQTIEREACAQHGLNPEALTIGALIGLVDLVGIIELDEAGYAAHRAEHRDLDPFAGPLFGWQLANPRPLSPPRPMPGRMGLFNIPDEPLPQPASLPQPRPRGEASVPEPEPALPALPPTWNPDKPFELRVIADRAQPDTAYSLAVYQRIIEPPNAQQTLYRQAPPETQRIVELGGGTLRAVADQVMEALRKSGYRATDLSASRREPFALAEEAGVRLGLLFLAVKPITKMVRVEAIDHGLRAMTSEEAYYWYSKCTTGPTADRALKALRVLLAGE